MESDYDAERRESEGNLGQFTLAGQTFRLKPAMGAREVGILVDHEHSIVANDRFPEGYYASLVAVIRATIVPDDREAWDELMAADLDNPIRLTQLITIGNDMIGDTAQRPPEQRSPSGPTGEPSSTRSTDASVLREAPALESSASGRA